MLKTKKNKTTLRGFDVYEEFKDYYGADIRVQKSSLATEDCVWIFTKGGTDNNDGALHLSKSQAIKLMTGLIEWLSEVVEEND